MHDGSRVQANQGRPRITWDEQRLADIARRWNITRLELFGSVVSDDFRPDSDIDILVTFAPDAYITLIDLVHIRDQLAALFGRDVDVIERGSIENSPNYIRRRDILRNPVTVYTGGDDGHPVA